MGGAGTTTEAHTVVRCATRTPGRILLFLILVLSSRPNASRVFWLQVELECRANAASAAQTQRPWPANPVLWLLRHAR